MVRVNSFAQVPGFNFFYHYEWPAVPFTHAIRYTIFEILFSDFEWEKTRYPEDIYFAGFIDIFRTVLKRSQRQVC